MTRARGQASRSLLNREFPHRVVVLSDNVRGRALDVPLDPAGWGQHSGERQSETATALCDSGARGQNRGTTNDG